MVISSTSAIEREAPSAEALAGAVERLDAAFDREPVDVYLATLYALDAGTGAHVDQAVGLPHHRFIVFDNQNGIP